MRQGRACGRGGPPPRGDPTRAWRDRRAVVAGRLDIDETSSEFRDREADRNDRSETAFLAIHTSHRCRAAFVIRAPIAIRGSIANADVLAPPGLMLSVDRTDPVVSRKALSSQFGFHLTDGDSDREPHLRSSVEFVADIFPLAARAGRRRRPRANPSPHPGHATQLETAAMARQVARRASLCARTCIAARLLPFMFP